MFKTKEKRTCLERRGINENFMSVGAARGVFSASVQRGARKEKGRESRINVPSIIRVEKL